jgi:hypothetical protein
MPAMGAEDGPRCPRHERAVAMSLWTLHSDATRPDQLVALFQCPECGAERRLPLAMGSVR